MSNAYETKQWKVRVMPWPELPRKLQGNMLSGILFEWPQREVLYDKRKQREMDGEHTNMPR